MTSLSDQMTSPHPETVALITGDELKAVKMRVISTKIARLAVYDTGAPGRANASSEVLVLWPSVLADHRIYNAQAAALRGRYRLILIDGPGHGASGPSTGSSACGPLTPGS